MRIVRLGFGCGWAAALLFMGLWLLDQSGGAFALWAIAASQLLFMVVVADDLYPRAPMVLTGALKALSGVLWWGVFLNNLLWYAIS